MVNLLVVNKNGREQINNRSGEGEQEGQPVNNITCQNLVTRNAFPEPAFCQTGI